MKRKILFISIVAFIISLFSVSYTFAAKNNMVDGIRNAVGGAENVVENAGSAVGKAVQGGMNTVTNGAKNVGNATENTIGAMTNRGDNNNYTATRTSATNDMGGVSTSTFSWVIIGVTAVGIVVLLWSYFTQNRENNVYIDSDDL